MNFKDRVRKYGLVNEMAIPKSKREDVLKQIREKIDKGDYKEAAAIFKRNGGGNITKDYKKEANSELGLNTQEVNKLRAAIKGTDSSEVSSKAEVAVQSAGNSDFIKSLKTSLETIKDKYETQLSVLKGNPIDMSSPASITRKDSREGVQNSKEYREKKIKELKNDLKALSTKINGFNEISDDRFKELSLEEKKEYMNKKKEARELQNKMQATLEKYDRGFNERKKQRGRPDSAINRAGENAKAGVVNLNKFEGILNKYNKAQPIKKTDLTELKDILTQWVPLLKDKTDPFYDPKQLGVVNRAIVKTNNLLDDDSKFEGGVLDVDETEDLFDELNNINIGK